MAENVPLRLLYSICLVLLACHVLTLNVTAQTDLGAFRGQVQDQRGAAIVGATVTLRNPSTAWERTAQTDGSGYYSFAGVPLTGQYTIR